ncbi:hypothetical protein BSLG_010773 [Batrachochytrium salamandrivorans]|nr:hypothetical protein BSLG_010773 [Batrachochytrium salamandrivorans]
MHRYTTVTPNRNPGFDNTVVIHEYTHGISNRLTGGASADSCLSTLEARGMGEGWGDMMAMMVLAKSSDTATTGIPIGAYVKNNPKGVRSHLYTTDMTVNPLTYVDLKTRLKVHSIANLYDAKQSAGNIAMKIIIGGMMLHSCNPTLLGARDAIITADVNHYKGANKCEIYKDLPSVASALGPPTFAQMTFRFHLNVSSDSAPVSYDDISTAY